VGDIAKLTTASTCREAGPLLSRRAFDLVVLDQALVDGDAAVFPKILSDRGGPAPSVIVYGSAVQDTPALPASLATLVKAQVDETTPRQTVIDELRIREDQLATRFQKSA